MKSLINNIIQRRNKEEAIYPVMFNDKQLSLLADVDYSLNKIFYMKSVLSYCIKNTDDEMVLRRSINRLYSRYKKYHYKIKEVSGGRMTFDKTSSISLAYFKILINDLVDAGLLQKEGRKFTVLHHTNEEKLTAEKNWCEFLARKKAEKEAKVAEALAKAEEVAAKEREESGSTDTVEYPTLEGIISRAKDVNPLLEDSEANSNIVKKDIVKQIARAYRGIQGRVNASKSELTTIAKCLLVVYKVDNPIVQCEIFNKIRNSAKNINLLGAVKYVEAIILEKVGAMDASPWEYGVDTTTSNSTAFGEFVLAPML